MHPGELEDGGHAVEEGADDEPVQGGGIVHLLRRMLAIDKDFNPNNNYIYSKFGRIFCSFVSPIVLRRLFNLW